MKKKIFTLIAMLLPMMASAFETENSNVSGTRGVGDINVGVVLHNVCSEDIYITGHIYLAVSTPTQNDWGPINIDLDPVSDGCAMYRIPAGQTAVIPSNQINYSVNSKDPNEVVSKYLGGVIYDWIYCRVYSWTDAHDPAVVRAECVSSTFQNGGNLEFNLVGIKHDEGIIRPCPNAITLGGNTTPDTPDTPDKPDTPDTPDTPDDPIPADFSTNLVLHNVSSEDINITGHMLIAIMSATGNDWIPVDIDLDPVSDGCAMYRIPAGQTATIPHEQLKFSVKEVDLKDIAGKYLGGAIMSNIYCRIYSWTNVSDPNIVQTKCLTTSFEKNGAIEFNLLGIDHERGDITPCPNAITLVDGELPDTPDVPEIKLSESKVTIQKGKTVTIKATVSPSTTDESLTWESSNTKVATVTSAGKVKGVKAGTATITCTSNSTGAKATCEVTVGLVKLDKTEAVINKGKTMILTATVYPSKLEDKSVTWESSNTKIATVTTAGKVKGVKAGTATITCTSNATGLSATCTVTVVKGIVTLNKTEAYVQKGKKLTLKATVTPETLADKSVTWESSDPKIATVTSEGKVKGVRYGTATITCTSVATGVKATCQVTVGKVVISMSEFSLKKSRGITLEAIVYPEDLADKSVTWKSSDKSIATVNEEGRVKGIKAGTATITCTSVATGLKGTCTVTVLSNSEARSMNGEDDELTDIKELESSAVAEPFDVYDLSGHKVLHQVTSLDGLSDGVYIVNGKKILKKK